MIKKFLCLVTAAFLVFGTAACKKEKETDNPATSMKYVEEEFGQVEGLDIPGTMVVNAQNKPVLQNAGAEKPEFLVVGPDGKAEGKITCEIDGKISAFTLDSQDNLYIVSAKPEENEITQRLHICDSQGKVNKTIALAGMSYASPDDYKKTITGIAVDNSGNIILSRIQETTLMLDKDGKEKFTLGEVIFHGTAQFGLDNSVIVYGNRTSDYKYALQKFNPTTGENLWTTTFAPRREEGISMGEVPTIRSDPQSGDIYLLTGDGIEKFDASGVHKGKILDFKEHMVLASGFHPKNFCVDSSGTFWLLAAESQLDSLPEKQADPADKTAPTEYADPAEQIEPSKPVRSGLFRYSLKQVNDNDTIPVTLSVPSSNRFLEVAVSKFNKENPGYRLTVKEAGEGERKTTYGEKYINTLSTELMSGLGPDIFSVVGLPYEKYTSKNVLADLTQMMEADTTFKADDYYTNILDAMKADGRLYVIPVSFVINALVSNKKALTERDITFDHTTWTWDDFKAIADQMTKKDGVYAIPPNTGYVLLSGSYGRFIDVQGKKASFDTGEFEKMLEMAKHFGIDGENTSSDGVGPFFETAERGAVIFSPQIIDQFLMLSASRVLFESDIEIFNFPGYDVAPRGGSFNCGEAFAINNNSKHKEIVWKFVKILLSEELQTVDELKGFPVSKNALRVMADKNNKLLTSDGIFVTVGVGGKPVNPTALTEQEISQVIEYIGGLTTCCHIDSKVLEMIRTEAESFFKGEKSAADAAKAIQQKVSIYLGE